MYKRNALSSSCHGTNALFDEIGIHVREATNVIIQNVHIRNVKKSGSPTSNGGDAIGICIPLKNANEETWTQLKPVLKKLKSDFNCDVYDLYGGQKLGLLNLDSFKNNLLR